MRRLTAILLPLACVATLSVAIPASAQDARSGVVTEFTPWSQITECQEDSSGQEISCYTSRVAPLAVRLGMDLSDSWSLEGGFLYGRLGSPDNAPAWAFSNNYVGTTIEAEGMLKWWFLQSAHVRLGYSHTYLDRNLNVYTGSTYSAMDVQTTYSGPFVGIGAGVDSSVIVKAHLDFFPYLAQRDSNAFANGSSGLTSLSWRAGGMLGYRITENLALLGGAGVKRFQTQEGADGPDGRRKTNWSSVMVGVQIGG